MMELKVIDKAGQDAGVITVNDSIFSREYNEPLVHQVVTAFLANARSGTRAQKTRSEVRKSTRKPWKQKGTGRARAGSAASPLWRGGGRTFPNSPDENFSQKVNRKMHRAAIAVILSQLIRDERLIVISDMECETPKTKNFTTFLQHVSLADQGALIVVDEFNENAFLASRNLTNVFLLEQHQIDPHSLLRFKKVVFTCKAIEKLQEQWT